MTTNVTVETAVSVAFINFHAKLMQSKVKETTSSDSGNHSVFVRVRSDLCTAFGKDVTKLVEVRPLINDLLTEGRRSKTNKTKTLATWATKELRKLKSQAWWGRRLSLTHTHPAGH